jgi:hypothetical protein
MCPWRRTYNHLLNREPPCLPAGRSTVELHRNIPILKKKNEKCKKKINLKVADTSLLADRWKVKDPMAFSNNQQSLLCMGFFGLKPSE